jgi:Universal stress protein family
MGLRRRAYEPGHKPKLMIVVDETPECARAVLFAARRVRRTGAGILMLAIIPREESQPWLGIGNLMEAEAQAEANARLDSAAEIIRREAGFEPERAIQAGEDASAVLAQIEADEDIVSLMLAAGTGSHGPGPLVTHVAREAAHFPVPVTIVPGGLAEADFDALT